MGVCQAENSGSLASNTVLGSRFRRERGLDVRGFLVTGWVGRFVVRWMMG